MKIDHVEKVIVEHESLSQSWIIPMKNGVEYVFYLWLYYYVKFANVISSPLGIYFFYIYLNECYTGYWLEGKDNISKEVSLALVTNTLWQP